MTAPAPYNRDTLAGIREAARNNVPLETYARKLGWTFSMLDNVCRRNCITMQSNPAAATEPVTRPAVRPADSTPVGGVMFGGDGNVWNGDRSIVLPADVMVALEMIARASPRVASRIKIAKAVFGTYGRAERERRMNAVVTTLVLRLPEIGCALAIFDDGAHLSLTKPTGARK